MRDADSSELVADLNGAGAQRRGQEQGAERPHAGPPGVQRPPPHTAVHGAHPQGTAPALVLPGVCQGEPGSLEQRVLDAIRKE